MGKDFEGTQAVEMESFGGEDTHVGAVPDLHQDDLGGCDGCKPGATQVFGKRAIGLPAGTATANGVTAGAAVTYKIAPICDTRLECLFVPTAQAPNFMVTSLKYQNTEMVAEANASVEGAGASSVDGVPLSEFLPFGTCANLLRGICVKANIPVTIVVVNITNALAELSIGLKGTST
jgi:hypothetical protein